MPTAARFAVYSYMTPEAGLIVSSRRVSEATDSSVVLLIEKE
jgi:hypothetical protein